MINLKLSFFILVTIFASVFVMGADEQKDLRPGSRTLYVKNHTPDGQAKTLELALRKCLCGNTKETFVCRCWKNHDPRDQPAVQGSPFPLLALNTLMRWSLPMFSVAQSDEGLIIKIPSPKFMQEIFTSLGIHNFELVEGNKPIDTEYYLKLLAQGKIPLADMPSCKPDEDNFLLYSIPIHDVFNHVVLWAVFPHVIHNHIKQNTKKLLSIFEILDTEFKNNTQARNFIALLKFEIVVNFDVNMGSLNNVLFNPEAPLDWQKGAQEKLEYLGSTCNLGVTFGSFEVSNNFVLTLFDLDQFAAKWFFIKIESLRRGFEELKESTDFSQFRFFKTIEKNNDLKAALMELYQQDQKEIKAISDALLSTVEKTLKIKPNNDPQPFERLISLQSFCVEIKLMLEETTRIFEKQNHH